MNKTFNTTYRKTLVPYITKVRLMVKQIYLPGHFKHLFRTVRFTNVYSDKLSIAFANLRV